MSESILQVNDLSKHFVVGHKDWRRQEPITVKAVDGVSFEIRRGETLGLVGESGSGKSTIAYLVAGMHDPTAGELTYRGKPLFDEKGNRPLALKKEIQIVFQDPGSSLNPRRTIEQILSVPIKIHHPEKDLLQEMLRLLDLVDLPSSYLHKYPHMLSGGEKQIVAIARALATEPELIILDEPTSALDVSVQGKVINLLMRLQKDLNLSYLFITHDLSLMRNIATRVAIMYLGKISEIAPGDTFFRNPEHPYTQMLLSSIPVISEAEEAMKPDKVISSGEIPSPVNIPVGCSFNTRCPLKVAPCMQTDPVMLPLEDEHFVRCHLFSGETQKS
ncbi:MAG: ABC transporter ATP-binding protein [Chloroflexota bacterium]